MEVLSEKIHMFNMTAATSTLLAAELSYALP